MNISLESLVRLQKQERWSEARLKCDELLHQNLQNADLWDFSGVLAIQMSDINKAVEHFERAVYFAPASAIFQNHLGNSLRMQGALHRAIRHYKQALELNPDYVEARNNLGNIYYRQGDYDAALEHYNEAIRIDPEYGDAFFNIGNIYCLRDDYQQALSYYQDSIRFQPENPVAYFNTGLAQRHLGLRQNAIRSFWHYIDRNPDAYDGYYYLALCYSELDQNDEAIAQYLRVLTLAPHHPEANHNLAALYHKQGNKESAIEYYQRAVKVNPGNRVAQFMLAALTGQCAPSEAPEDYIRFLFNQYAQHYEQHLQQRLMYRAPQLLQQAFKKTSLSRHFGLRIADLGCGTGLCGPLFKPYAETLVGVDLSVAMLEVAKKTGFYDECTEGNFVNFLFKQRLSFDVLLAADVLIYMGDLSLCFNACDSALKTKGLWLFTTEVTDMPGFELTPTGRYAHNETYLRELAQQCNFTILCLDKVSTRLHEDTPVKAWLAVMQKN